MAISYLSKPLQSEVKPFQENLDLISKVSAYKQSRYDKVIDTILQKQDSLLNLDTSKGSEEATQKKENMLKQADVQLDALSKVDLLNPENINKAEIIFEPITNDQDIIQAAGITSFVNKQGKYFDEWKKDGKGLYDAKNEAYFREQVQKNTNMSLKEVKEKGYSQPLATEFVDIDKWYRESVKELHPNITMTIAPDGKGRIFKDKNTILSEEDVLKMLPTNSKIIAQAEINAHYDYADVKKDELLSIQQKSLLQEQQSVKTAMNEANKQIGYLQDQIKAIENGTTEGNTLVTNSGFLKDQLIEQLKDKIKGYQDLSSKFNEKYKEYGTKISDFNTTYKFDKGIFNTELTENELKNLKTSVWLNSKKQQFADAMSYQERILDIETDQVQLEEMKHQWGLEDKYIDHVYREMEEQDKKDKENSTKTLDILDAFGATPANDKTTEVDNKEKGNEFNSLVKGFNEYATNINKLKGRFIEDKKFEDENYDEVKFEADKKDFIKTLAIYDKNNYKLSDKIPNSEETFAQFFQRNAKIKEYYTTKQSMDDVYNSHLMTIAKINEKAEKRALGETGFSKEPKDIKIETGINAAPIITIPKSMYERYITKSLTQKDYNEIRNINNYRFIEEGENPDKLIKSFVDNFRNEEKLINFQDLYLKYKNEYAKEFQKGYLLPGLYLKEITGEKSTGKHINESAVNYIGSFYKDNPEINIKYFYRDANSPSGWSVNYSSTTKDANNKSTSVIDQKALQPDFVKDTKLNLVGNVSDIKKELELQRIGNPDSKSQIFMYNYLGKVYKLVQQDGAYKALEKQKDGTFKLLKEDSPSVDILVQSIIENREQELNRK